MFKIIVSIALLLAGAVDAMAVEEAKYEVVKQEDKFEIREYAPHILAETVVAGSLEDAGSMAFKRLFRYISGDNRSGNKVEMTAPVSQAPAGEKIEMTAPVGQQPGDGGWVVSFMMPSHYTLESLPQPTDPKITLRRVAARRIAVVRYSGFWSEKGYLKQKSELAEWIRKLGLKISGDPVWARYNPPFMPWFMRRNEVMYPIEP